MFLIGSPGQEVSNLLIEAAEAPQLHLVSSHLALPGDSIPSPAPVGKLFKAIKVRVQYTSYSLFITQST